MVSRSSVSIGLGLLILSSTFACSSSTTSEPGATGGAATGGEAATGGTSSGGATSGGASSTGSGGATGGAAVGTGGGASDPGRGDVSRCDAAGLTWKTGHKTNYTSYPDPNSIECLPPEQGGYNGCMWSGYFASCSEKQSEAWVEAHNIAAVFPDDGLERHDICIRSGDTVMVVTVLDTCGDSDCDGCCTENKGDADALIDLESFTNERWGLADGNIEWADLGENPDPGCPG